MNRGYVNGNDMLLAINGKQVGHSTEHVTNYNTTTKERAVKAPEKEKISVSLFKELTVTGLEITVSFKGLRVYDEDGLSVELLRSMWKNAQPVPFECYDRPANGVTGSNRDPYLVANGIITKLTENAPADDDVTFDGEIKMSGAPTTWKEPATASNAPAGASGVPAAVTNDPEE